MIQFLITLACFFLQPPQEADEKLYTTESLSFSSAHFEIMGDLRLPIPTTKHPALIFVYGDGPANRKNLGVLEQTIHCFLKSGFACLIYDKPGSGQSKGRFTRDKLFDERAGIVRDAVALLKKHPSIDPGFIGLWGISQAGYVMPLALTKTKGIAFMIAISCPAMDSIDQSAYLIRQQMICEGCNTEEANVAEKQFIQRSKAQTYPEYLAAAKYLDNLPVIKRMGWGGVTSKKSFSTLPKDCQYFFNPITIIEKTTIPILAIFGGKDTQVDPIQGFDAYKKAIKKSGAPCCQVKLILNADHGLCETKTGGMDEIGRRYRENKIKHVPGYLDTLEAWVKRIRENIPSR